MEKEKKTVNEEKKKNVVKKTKKTIDKKPAKKETEKKPVKANKSVKKVEVEKVVKTEKPQVKKEIPKEEHIPVKSVPIKEEHTPVKSEPVIVEHHHQASSEVKKETKTRVKKDNSSNSMFIIYLVLILLIILFIFLIVINNVGEKDKYQNIITQNNALAVNGEVIESYDEFKSKFGSNKLSESSFEDNNYAVLIVSYDDCSQKNFSLEKYEKVGNQLRAYFTLEKNCKECTSKFRYYFLPVDKDVKEELNVSIDYQTKNNPKCEQ